MILQGVIPDEEVRAESLSGNYSPLKRLDTRISGMMYLFGALHS